jgi:phosphate transport system permease protein
MPALGTKNPADVGGWGHELPLQHRTLPGWASGAVLGLAVLVVVVVGYALDANLVLSCIFGIVLYTVLIWGWSRAVEGRRSAIDRAVTAAVCTAFGIAMVPLVWLITTVLVRGLPAMSLQFLTYSMRNVIAEGGGIYHAIVGTVLVTLAAAIVSVPIGLFCAIYLVEYGQGALARAITFLVDVMTGIPSIVAGLFAYALFVLLFGPGVRLGAMGALALSVLMIPVVVRSGEEMFKLVPNELREASYALGVPKWRTIVKVVLPTSAAGVATGVMLAIARVIGETAPLLITMGFTATTNVNLFNGRMTTLPVFTYYSVTQPGVPPEPYIERAWGAALVLILIVMGLNLIARLISKMFAPKTGR